MRARERRNTRTLVGALAGISLVAAACGSDGNDAEPATAEMDMNDEVHTDPDMDMEDDLEDDSESDIGDPMDEGFDAEQDDGGDGEDAPVTTEVEPEAGTGEMRIVSLSPTATETMFAIGAGDLLVAVDQNSNFPDAALDLPNELSGFEPNVEAIAAFEPDLVLIGGDFTGLGDQLTELEIEFLDLPPAGTIDDAYAQIEQLGAATGNVGEAAELVGQMQGDIDAIVERVGGAAEGVSFYHEISDTFFSADSTTFIGELYSLLDMVNIADADESESFGFPQLNAEFIIEQNPDVIFVPTGTFAFTTADDVAGRPGWDSIAAVQDGNVIETNDEIGGRWGPRIVLILDEVATAVESLDVGVTAES
ncbi:MAG: ABC transporter substrate-binding protein [Ilumatobacter sp.]